MICFVDSDDVDSNSNYVTADTSESQKKMQTEDKQIEIKAETLVSPISDEYYLWNNENITIH